ncbi:hypothetical protein BQ8482_280112 [Mesorhizobium delmotii]|uniref:Uncharacterized protein n=1 Tax=Mesorhizobium delmotii TaxID=1631247 RepID=A0A2P9AML7_9HYPH|nr:hypothetical protein BQ8482_280112 [Mesorhizobium delmotii]
MRTRRWYANDHDIYPSDFLLVLKSEHGSGSNVACRSTSGRHSNKRRSRVRANGAAAAHTNGDGRAPDGVVAINPQREWIAKVRISNGAPSRPWPLTMRVYDSFNGA